MLLVDRDTCRTVCAIVLHCKTNITLTLTITDTGGTVLTLMLGYRTTWVVLQNCMQIEFVHTQLHTPQ